MKDSDSLEGGSIPSVAAIYARLAQWKVHEPSKPVTWVRFLQRVPYAGEA